MVEITWPEILEIPATERYFLVGVPSIFDVTTQWQLSLSDYNQEWQLRTRYSDNLSSKHCFM